MKKKHVSLKELFKKEASKRDLELSLYSKYGTPTRRQNEKAN